MRAGFGAVIVVEKGVGQDAEQPAGLLCVLLLPLLAFTLLLGVGEQLLEAPVVLGALLGAERLAVQRDQAGDQAVAGVNDVARPGALAALEIGRASCRERV